MTKYIALPNTWFDEGTEAILIADFRSDDEPSYNAGLFEGWRTCEYPEAENRKLGEKYRDQEDCAFDEFMEIDEDDEG